MIIIMMTINVNYKARLILLIIIIHHHRLKRVEDRYMGALLSGMAMSNQQSTNQM